MNYDTATNIDLFDIDRTNNVSVVYKDFTKLHKGLGSLELYRTQLMLEQVYAQFEREIFHQIKRSRG